MKLYFAVCVVSIIRALIMPFVLLFRNEEYRLNYYIAEDQSCNTVFAGMPDETISARSYRCSWKLSALINNLFKNPNHTKEAFESEVERKHLPAEYRKDEISNP